MSTEPSKAAPRRDRDPVRAYADGRVAYWTGGQPGLGHREMERCGTLVAAEARAIELREILASSPGRAPRANATLDSMVQAALDTLRAQGSPEGTVRQYKSNWNTWIPPSIGRSQCREASLWHWTKIFDHLESQGAPESTITAVARTLGTMIEWGSDRGYFGAEPFGPAAKRGRVVEKASRRAKVKRPPDKKISLDMCPTVANVEDFAQAVEAQYPQYGERLVYLAYGSGLRICELLSLKSDSIDLATGDIAVDTQLDRYGKWPDVQLPKGGKTRVAFLWRCYWDVAASLAKDAEARTGDEHGWLFPRHRSVTKWADQAGKLIGAAVLTADDWHWTFHWLRHGYASVSVTPKEFGGYGLPIVSVSKWLGHAAPSTTQDMYVQRPANDTKIAAQLTAQPPGWVGVMKQNG